MAAGEQEPCPPDLLRWPRLAHAAYLVGRQVVHHDDVAGARSSGAGTLFGIGQEGGTIHGAIEQPIGAAMTRTAAGPAVAKVVGLPMAVSRNPGPPGIARRMAQRPA